MIINQCDMHMYILSIIGLFMCPLSVYPTVGYLGLWFRVIKLRSISEKTLLKCLALNSPIVLLLTERLHRWYIRAKNK